MRTGLLGHMEEAEMRLEVNYRGHENGHADGILLMRSDTTP